MKPLSRSLIIFAVAVYLASNAAAQKRPGTDTSNPFYANVDVSLAPKDPSHPAKPAGFIHPGVL